MNNSLILSLEWQISITAIKVWWLTALSLNKYYSTLNSTSEITAVIWQLPQSINNKMHSLVFTMYWISLLTIGLHLTDVLIPGMHTIPNTAAVHCLSLPCITLCLVNEVLQINLSLLANMINAKWCSNFKLLRHTLLTTAGSVYCYSRLLQH